MVLKKELLGLAATLGTLFRRAAVEDINLLETILANIVWGVVLLLECMLYVTAGLRLQLFLYSLKKKNFFVKLLPQSVFGGGVERDEAVYRE